MDLSKYLIVFAAVFTVSLSAVELQQSAGGQSAASFVLNQPQASSTAAVYGQQYPYTITYDPGVWELYTGDPGDSIEYGFAKLDGSKAKLTVQWHDERVHYQEVPDYLMDELTGCGLTDVEIHDFEMIEHNGKYFIFVHISGDMPDGDKLMGYVLHYLTDDGMLRFAFATIEADGDVHDEDFTKLLDGIQIND